MEKSDFNKSVQRDIDHMVTRAERINDEMFCEEITTPCNKEKRDSQDWINEKMKTKTALQNLISFLYGKLSEEDYEEFTILMRDYITEKAELNLEIIKESFK